jgi:uncharacterized membrane protein
LERGAGRYGNLNDETQKRLITILSSMIAYVLAGRLSDILIKEPEVRGVRDDLKEALLKAGFSLVSTIIASFVIRRVVASRWGP